MRLGWWRRRGQEAPAVRDESESGEWQVLAAARQQESRDGQVLEYPGRTARCPRGHTRVIPSRFDRPVVELPCTACGRRYPLRQS
jgi:hypothetical protein